MEPAIEWERARALNRARWDALAELHGQDAYYDTEALVAGRDTLTPEENDAIQASVHSVNGLDVLHVQCHIGFDSISLARRGARVTGLDFSAASLAKATMIAQRCGTEIEWVEADSTAIGPSLAGRFDLAYATIGVLSWIADVGAWMRSVHSTVRPGGRLILIDTHPLQDMINTPRPLTFDMPTTVGTCSRAKAPTRSRTPSCQVARFTTPTRSERSSVLQRPPDCGSTD
jgi:2-polyprenyl-3-methyl-5-hydroxy-6-metoxy-1,4-benzoquinol methylase